MGSLDWYPPETTSLGMVAFGGLGRTAVLATHRGDKSEPENFRCTMIFHMYNDMAHFSHLTFADKGESPRAVSCCHKSRGYER